MTLLVFRVAILLAVVAPLLCQPCPSGCNCGNIIKCSGLTDFPSFIGTENRVIEIDSSNFQEIPPYAFQGNVILNSITISNANIGRIRTCAFNGLAENPRFININNANISVIESGAFENITFDSEPRLSISTSNISVIEPYAFSNLTASRDFILEKLYIKTIRSYAFSNLTFRTFRMDKLNIDTIESDAFYNFTRVRRFNLLSSNVTTLNCNTLNKVSEQVSAQSLITGTYFTCDCSLAWLVALNIGLEPNVQCSNPVNLRDTSIRDLNVTTVCPSGNYTTTCAMSQKERPGSCPSATGSSGSLIASFSLIFTFFWFNSKFC